LKAPAPRECDAPSSVAVVIGTMIFMGSEGAYFDALQRR
jgi:hypothetical protein